MYGICSGTSRGKIWIACVLSSSLAGWLVPAALGQIDADGDNCVDLEDFALLQNAWDGPACPIQDDFMPMVLVPGGVAGPDYDFLIGKYEVTNEQFVVFINDLYSYHGSDSVLSPSETEYFCNTIGTGGWPIIEATGRFRGPRFRVVPGYEKHPAITAWRHAAEFCNWLTIRVGLPESDRCYVRDEESFSYRPVVISQADWEVRDLSLSERTQLVQNHRGFRLPMDNTPWVVGSGIDIHAPFNEWYKAASMGEHALRTAFGFGRDVLGARDANFENSNDPFDFGFRFSTTPVGFFDGFNVLGAGCQTRDSENLFGAYDLSGNVGEWVQDRGLQVGTFGVRGGSFRSTEASMGVGERTSGDGRAYPMDVGFRVVRVP